MAPSFTRLNRDWNADPNGPGESVEVLGSTVVLTFRLAAFFNEPWWGKLTFEECTRYRLGPENDEAWYRGQCRFSKLAPDWGEFYEVSGDLMAEQRTDWVVLNADATDPVRHFLFYLRDSMFECDAARYRLEAPGFS
jgi:hypothetical protein